MRDLRIVMWTTIAMLAMPTATECPGGQVGGAPPRPANLPVLKKDVVVVVAGSSVSMNRYGCRPLPKWTGGVNRVPPQSYGQNVFFRIFEMLNDHENMCWRRLPDEDWERRGNWEAETKLPYNGPCYGKRVSFAATEPDDWAELSVPAGYEKLDLIYTSDPKGDTMNVTIDGKAPRKNAIVDTSQEVAIPAGEDLGGDLQTIDSHGNIRRLKRPTRGISNIVELRARYELDPAKPHRVRVQRATSEPGKRILLWGAVYWRGNCVQVVQRAKGGINCGDLPNYAAIQEIMAVNPDYVLMEAINIREHPATVARTLEGAFAWCAGQVRQGRFKMLVYATPQANSQTFRKWFRDPAHKPPYGAKDYAATCSDENCDECHQVVVDLCKRLGFPLVDIGPVVDAYCDNHKSAKFVPHVLNDWYHPNQWGAALFGHAIYGGIKRHWPELPVRPVTMPDAPQ